MTNRQLRLAAAATAMCLSVASYAQESDRLELVSKIVPAEIFICNYNDGQGPAELDAAVAAWNGYMDENGIDSYAAWTLTPYYFGADQDFDVIWLGAWTDGNAMGTGTDMWMSTGGKYMANFNKVVTCRSHLNSGSINYKLPEGGTPGNAVLSFSNCTIEDGRNYAEVVQATKQWASILTGAGSQAAIYHWFPIYGGGGDDAPDFVRLTGYPNYTEWGADYERITNGELFRQMNDLFGGLVDCDVARVYNAKSRRSAKLR